MENGWIDAIVKLYEENLSKLEFELLYNPNGKTYDFFDKKVEKALQCIHTRNQKKDISIYYNCQINEIATNFEEISDSTKYLYYYTTTYCKSKIIVGQELEYIKNAKNAINKTNDLTEDEISILYNKTTLESEYKNNILEEKFKEKISKRNIKEDLAFLYEIDESEVALNPEEINSNTSCYYEQNINSILSSESLSGVKEFIGIVDRVKTAGKISEEDLAEADQNYIYRSYIYNLSNLRLKHYLLELRSTLKEFKYKRDEAEFYAKAKGIPINNIAYLPNALKNSKNKIEIYCGDLSIEEDFIPDYLSDIKYIIGNAYFKNVKTMNGLDKLVEVHGTLFVENLQDIGIMNQNIEHDGMILSECFFNPENLKKIKSNTILESYLVYSYYEYFNEDKYSSDFDDQKSLEDKMNEILKEIELLSVYKDNDNDNDNVDYTSYRNVDDLIDYHQRNGIWPEHIDNPLSAEDFICNELHEYMQELLSEEDYLEDEIKEKLLEEDSSFFETYYY